MTQGGWPSGGPNPFGGPALVGSPGGGPSGYGPAPSSHGPPPPAEVNVLATLSVVFAVVFAPAGAVLGHVALAQIHQHEQPGRDRAIIGLVSSYVVIVAAIVALMVWLIGGGAEAPPAATTAPTKTPTTTPTTTSTPTATTATRAAPPRTTVATAPTSGRPSVRIQDLKVGDCVEVQKSAPVPGQPDANFIMVYRTPCQVRDGVVQVDQIVSDQALCGTSLVLYDQTKTFNACVSDFKG